MSYILNALRKSEQERQAKEGPTLENRVLGERETQKPWKTWLVVALIIINLVTLSFFFFQSRRQPGSETMLKPEKKAKDQSVAALRPEPVKKNKKSSAELRREMFQPSDRKKTGKKTPSISESVEKRKSAPAKPAPKPTLEEKVSKLVNVTNEEGLTVLKRSETKEDTESSVDSAKPELSEQTPSSTNPTKDSAGEVVDKTQLEQSPAENLSGNNEKPDRNGAGSKSPTEKSAKTSNQGDKKKPVLAPKRPARKTAKPKIPFLEDLPVEFRRKFPDLNINVYVFSEEPEDSFIMVDMVKYVPGQNISEGLELKDIRHESMVVEYEGKKVRIRRP